MTTKIGYTRREADRLHAQLGRCMGNIEMAAEHMLELVTDHEASVENQLEDLRATYHTLWEIVERRVR